MFSEQDLECSEKRVDKKLLSNKYNLLLVKKLKCIHVRCKSVIYSDKLSIDLSTQVSRVLTKKSEQKKIESPARYFRHFYLRHPVQKHPPSFGPIKKHS